MFNDFPPNNKMMISRKSIIHNPSIVIEITSTRNDVEGLETKFLINQTSKGQSVQKSSPYLAAIFGEFSVGTTHIARLSVCMADGRAACSRGPGQRVYD